MAGVWLASSVTARQKAQRQDFHQFVQHPGYNTQGNQTAIAKHKREKQVPPSRPRKSAAVTHAQPLPPASGSSNGTTSFTLGSSSMSLGAALLDVIAAICIVAAMLLLTIADGFSKFTDKTFFSLNLVLLSVLVGGGERMLLAEFELAARQRAISKSRTVPVVLV